MQTLNTPDYIVIGMMLALSFGIGVFFAVRSKNTRETYLLGNRQMGVFSVAISMFVTTQSAVSLLGYPAEIYTYGTMIIYLFISRSFTYLAGVYTCLPLLYPLRIVSIFEYLGRRFDSTAVRIYGTFLGMLQTVIYMAVALFSPALALQVSAGIPLWMSIVIVGLVGTVYTSIGGIQGVVWTDVLQSVFMLGGMVLVIVLSIGRIGTLQKVWEINHQEGRIQFDELSPDPRVRHTVWGLFLGGFFNWYVNMFNQATMQRMCAIRSMKGSKIAFLLNIPMLLIYGVLLVITGLQLAAYVFTTQCDPYEAGYITNRNQMMPYFVLDILGSYPGLAGLYMSSLFSGALSTLSSGINALAANTVADILVVPLRRSSERTSTIIAKLAVCFYGLLAIGMAYMIRSLQGPITQMTHAVWGAGGGPVLGMFFLGAVFPKANKVGALCGGISALLVTVTLSILQELHGVKPTTLNPAPLDACPGESYLEANSTMAFTTPKILNTTFPQDYILNSHHEGLSAVPFYLYDVSYVWYGFIGFLVVLVVGVVTSWITASRYPQTVDPQLLFPFARRLWKLSSTSGMQLTPLPGNETYVPSRKNSHDETLPVPFNTATRTPQQV
ncbi:sodium-coupled monocarboxylate transporter 1-like [Haliotis rufescens]|uniref:sodium-coupled monocarboxylate transporter 1-like n=1 Tax=Haliotis rufescens TaxID=6454 RepID=UPI00201F144F|nr:sodium-coupled monocarboxylate transporter 1-like [Haliotis rufescens]